MLTYYLVLGLSPDASVEEIRSRYLQLVKTSTPEKDPDGFRKITKAYEAVKDNQSRVHHKIFGYANQEPEEGLYALIRAKALKRRRVGLKELFDASA